MADFTVIRNEPHTQGAMEVSWRHNERQNSSYQNICVIEERSDMNVHYRACVGADGQPETYEQTFKRLLAEGVIVKRGLQADAKVMDEMVLDVNSAYFERNGGYEYAKQFYAEAYKMAVEAIGGEQFVISAVMHADEWSKSDSEKCGHDVYHYHLHVVYVPVVKKEIYYQRTNKNPELAGKLKEVVTQISHSKKWPRLKNDKGFWINSYSLLQDQYHDHMKAAGFSGFERGVLGSTAEHLSDLEYKSKREAERAAELEAKNAQAAKELETAQNSLSTAQTNLTTAQSQLATTDKQLAEKKKKLHVAKVNGAAFVDIENAAKPTFIGDKVTLSKEDWSRISKLAELGVVAEEQRETSQAQVAAYKKSAEQAHQELARVKTAVKRGDTSVVYTMDEKIKMAGKQAERDNAARTAPTVTKNTNRGAI